MCHASHLLTYVSNQTSGKSHVLLHGKGTVGLSPGDTSYAPTATSAASATSTAVLTTSATKSWQDQPARPCSRCGGELLLRWHGPLMTRVWMELCAACDARRPAARSFIRWYRHADRDPKALPQLFEDWETETMHAHGWARAPQFAPPESPAPPPGLTPRGRG
ncbi:DUF6300 family protein [Streptomyces sp. NPDC102476]|uniref:DUF6300 family protein n=1 Tax=Streptomyces sp. NPDC102476 TaxID=3366181 RepID=UPI0037FB6A94